MNIDRPLDEFVKESQLAKRAARLEKRKAFKPKTTTPAPNGGPSRSQTEPKLPVAKKRAGITKKRRVRKVSANAAAALQDNPTNIPPPRNQPNSTPVSHRLSAPSRKVPRSPKGVKVAVSNLHPGVTQTDIAELFETVGPLKSATLRLFANGLSACEAEVVFENMQDALEAIKRYNLVPLDNQPLQITLATDSIHVQQEPVQNRVGKQRSRGQGNGRKKHGGPMDSADYEEEEDASPPHGNGYAAERTSPHEDAPGSNGPPGQGRRQNRRRYRRGNKPGAGNGNINGGDRDAYVD